MLRRRSISRGPTKDLERSNNRVAITTSPGTKLHSWNTIFDQIPPAYLHLSETNVKKCSFRVKNWSSKKARHSAGLAQNRWTALFFDFGKLSRLTVKCSCQIHPVRPDCYEGTFAPKGSTVFSWSGSTKVPPLMQDSSFITCLATNDSTYVGVARVAGSGIPREKGNQNPMQSSSSSRTSNT